MMVGRESFVHAEYSGAGPAIDLLTLDGEIWEIKPWDDAEQGAREVRDLRQRDESCSKYWPTARNRSFGRDYNWNEHPMLMGSWDYHFHQERS